MTNAQALELVSQIGKGNIFAISGGRGAITGGELLRSQRHLHGAARVPWQGQG